MPAAPYPVLNINGTPRAQYLGDRIAPFCTEVNVKYGQIKLNRGR
jgi:hypothetical protein